MAVLSMFYGIIVSMYFFDNKRHHAPHVHVKYQEEEAVVAIEDSQILEGEISDRSRHLLMAWMEIHREELMADWYLASNGEQVFKIEPLR